MSFIKGNELNYMNCFFQFIIALCAVIAICITIQQISSKTKINLKMKMAFRLNKIENDKTIVELEIKIVNMGMASVYITACGIQLRKHRKKKPKVAISDKLFRLKPGEHISVVGEYPGDIIDDSSSTYDRVYMYVESQLGKMYYYNKDIMRYEEFWHQYQKFKKRADKDNEKNNCINNS